MRPSRTALTSISVLLIGAQLCGAADISVVYGEPKYTVSLDGLNTVYYTPSLCSKDVTQSLPASDELILALKLGNGATVFGFQVAIKDQLNSDQQEQIVVRVGDVVPDEGPSDNPLCSIATVNATTLMATFECTEPLNGTYITVTKNDGGKMNICGFSASLGDESPVDGLPVLEPESIGMMQLENDGTASEVQAVQTFIQAPAPSVGAANRSNRVVFGGVAANPILIRAAVPVPAPGPALSPSIAQALPVITSRTGKDGIPEELAPAPGLQTTYVFSATADKQDNATAPTEDDSLTGLPAMADIGTPEVQPQILVTPTNVSINQIAPSPSPGPAPVQLPQQSLVFASDTDPSPAPEPAPAPAPSQDEDEDEDDKDTPDVGDNADLPATSTDASADAPSQLGRTSLIQEIQPPPAENSSGTSQASPSTKSGSGLSGGDKAGIAIGVIAGVALLAAAAYFIVQRRR